MVEYKFDMDFKPAGAIFRDISGLAVIVPDDMANITLKSAPIGIGMSKKSISMFITTVSAARSSPTPNGGSSLSGSCSTVTVRGSMSCFAKP